MPGSMPATSQLDWLISTTVMIVLSWSRATRDLLKSFGWGIRALHQLATATMVPSPRRLPHTISPLEEARFEPAVPVRRMYVNTEIAADREQPSRRLAGKRQNCRVGTAAWPAPLIIRRGSDVAPLHRYERTHPLLGSHRRGRCIGQVLGGEVSNWSSAPCVDFHAH